MSSATVVPEVRPLSGPAVGAAIALAATAAQLLLHLPTTWTAYRALAAYAEGGEGKYIIPVILRRAVGTDLLSVAGPAVTFGCALAFLAAWVLRARRNAAKVAPRHPFRYSPVAAVAALLAPAGILVLAGPVLAEIAAASRPPTARPRPVLDRVWWFGLLAAALGFTAAAVAARWTAVGSESGGEGPTNEIPTPTELSAQLAVAGLQTFATVGFVVGVVLLIATVIRIGRWQAPTTHAATSPVIDEASGVQRPTQVRMVVGGAAVAVVLLGSMVVMNVVAVASHRWDLTGLEGQAFIFFVVPPVALTIGEVVALCVTTARFWRQPRRSAVGLVVVACVVAWLRLLLGPLGPLPRELGIDVRVVNWVALFACLATVFMVERSSRPVRQ